MSYYKIIKGIRYDRRLLEAAEAFTKGRGESRISLEEIQDLHQLATDAGKITGLEWRTLQYIAQEFNLTEPAKKWITAQFEQNSVGDLDESIKRIIRSEYGLGNLTWAIDLEEVKRQTAGHARDFSSVLRSALEAFLRWNQGQLSFSAVVSRRDLAFDQSPNHEAFLKKYLDKGQLILLPVAAEDQSNLDFDVPEGLDFNTFWIFGLQIPEFFPVQFYAFVLRDQPGQYSKGGFSRKPDVETLAQRVIKQYAQYSYLKWQIDPAEVERQLAILPRQNFGNALFYAIHEGIYNGESSFSFRDFIGNEVWVDPDREIADYQREYIESGTLRLLSTADNPAFTVPSNFWPGTEGQWVFGLEMPRKTNARFVITVARDLEEASFNDGFVIETMSFYERVQDIFANEFKVDGLQLVVNEEHLPEVEFEAQRTQFGPDWRRFSDVLRQALNTILHDYIRPFSVFNIVKEVRSADVSRENYDTDQEYRDAVRHYIREYLKTGSIEFLPIELPDNNPVDGELVQDHWLFFVLLPDLSDHGFFVVLPRWPDDGQQGYNYGFN
jgi:hypothetical protein